MWISSWSFELAVNTTIVLSFFLSSWQGAQKKMLISGLLGDWLVFKSFGFQSLWSKPRESESEWEKCVQRQNVRANSKSVSCVFSWQEKGGSFILSNCHRNWERKAERPWYDIPIVNTLTLSSGSFSFIYFNLALDHFNFNKTIICCNLEDLLVSTSTTSYTLPRPSAW